MYKIVIHALVRSGFLVALAADRMNHAKKYSSAAAQKRYQCQYNELRRKWDLFIDYLERKERSIEFSRAYASIHRDLSRKFERQERRIKFLEDANRSLFEQKEFYKRQNRNLKCRHCDDLEKMHALKKENTQLREFAMIDPLTKIGNRRAMEAYVEDVGRAASRDAFEHPEDDNLLPAFVMVDIDHFKNFNDTYGHDKGDMVLCRIAQEIQKLLRRPGDKVFRWGGEEFVIVLPKTPVEEAAKIAENIRRWICDHTGGLETVSMGVSDVLFSDDPGVKSADKCLYCAKEAGRNRVVYNNKSLGIEVMMFLVDK